MAQKSLLKHIDVGDDRVEVYAKTGTLEGVRSYAGYIQVKDKDVVANYTFVFIFNRNVPFKYRDAMLSKLLKDLQQWGPLGRLRRTHRIKPVGRV